MIAWNVYIEGRLLTTVFYNETCDAEYVRTTLINHDGYPSHIKVRRG